MLREVLAILDDPSRQASRLAVRAGLVVAALGLAWTLLAGGVVFGVLGLYWSLLPHLGRAGAAAIVGGATFVVGLSVVLLYGRKSSHETSAEASGSTLAGMPDLANELVAGYPLESLAAALAAGLLASSVDLTQVVQQLGPTLQQLFVATGTPPTRKPQA